MRRNDVIDLVVVTTFVCIGFLLLVAGILLLMGLKSFGSHFVWGGVGLSSLGVIVSTISLGVYIKSRKHN